MDLDQLQIDDTSKRRNRASAKPDARAQVLAVSELITSTSHISDVRNDIENMRMKIKHRWARARMWSARPCMPRIAVGMRAAHSSLARRAGMCTTSQAPVEELTADCGMKEQLLRSGFRSDRVICPVAQEPPHSKATHESACSPPVRWSVLPTRWTARGLGHCHGQRCTEISATSQIQIINRDVQGNGRVLRSRVGSGHEHGDTNEYSKITDKPAMKGSNEQQRLGFSLPPSGGPLVCDSGAEIG